VNSSGSAPWRRGRGVVELAASMDPVLATLGGACTPTFSPAVVRASADGSLRLAEQPELGPACDPALRAGHPSQRKVSQAAKSPVSKPRRNQLDRCAEVPWVKESGTTMPRA